MVRRWTYYVACALLFLSLGTTAVAQTRAVNEHSKGDRLRSSSGKRVNGSGLRTTAYDGIWKDYGMAGFPMGKDGDGKDYKMTPSDKATTDLSDYIGVSPLFEMYLA